MATRIPNSADNFYHITELWAHPWSDWLNGETWLLDPQEDFESKDPERCRRQVYYVARSRELGVHTRITQDGKLLIRAYEI